MAISKEQRERAERLRAAIDVGIAEASEKPAAINGMLAAVRQWKGAPYSIGDVRVYEGVPYRCVQAHDSTDNPGWTPPGAPALWMQYHGTSRDTARPWVQPQGAHDQYLAGEWMIYHGAYYECVHDTTYTPDQYANAWRKG